MTGGRKPSGLGNAGLATGSVIALAGLVATILLAALTIPGMAAADEPFRIEFDDNEIAIGPVGNLPLQEIASDSSIEGTVDSQGRVSIPKAKFKLPILGIDQPVGVRGYMGIEDDATGTWDPTTGRLEIDAKAGLWLSIDVAATLDALETAGVNIPNLGPLQFLISSIGDLTCGFSPMDVTFTTETTPLGAGQRFTKGLNGPGALTVNWSKLGPFAGKTQILFFDVCTTLRSFAPTLITSLVGTSIPGLDLGGFDIAGLLENLDNVDLGASSLTISRTIDESVPASLKLAPGPTSLRGKAGSAVRVPVRVTNPGEGPATGVNICPRLPKASGISGGCVRVGVIAPGRTVTRALMLKPSKSKTRSQRPGGKGGRKAVARTVRFSVAVTGDGLPTQTRGLTLRVSG